MLNYHNTETSLPIVDQLYTAKGSQGFGTNDDIWQYGVDPENFKELVLLIWYNNWGERSLNYKLRTLFTTKTKPAFIDNHKDEFGLI